MIIVLHVKVNVYILYIYFNTMSLECSKNYIISIKCKICFITIYFLFNHNYFFSNVVGIYIIIKLV